MIYCPRCAEPNQNDMHGGLKMFTCVKCGLTWIMRVLVSAAVVKAHA